MDGTDPPATVTHKRDWWTSLRKWLGWFLAIAVAPILMGWRSELETSSQRVALAGCAGFCWGIAFVCLRKPKTTAPSAAPRHLA